jgi:beta-glucosidase
MSAPGQVLKFEYPYETTEPQKLGWPLSKEERSYVLKPEYERRPGSEKMKYLPAFWPTVPSAGYWSGTAWLDTHRKLVEHVQSRKGPTDILLVGDSITQQWGSPLDGKKLNDAWKKHLGAYDAVNIGIGGDKTQNVLWRLDHGGVDGLKPRAIILMIGNNNMFFTAETGIEPASKGIAACVANLQHKFPGTPLVLVKILPAHEPGHKFYDDICKTNKALDDLKLAALPNLKILDLTSDFTKPDGSLISELYTPDNVHLSDTGYDLYAKRLKPHLEAVLAGKP